MKYWLLLLHSINFLACENGPDNHSHTAAPSPVVDTVGTPLKQSGKVHRAPNQNADVNFPYDLARPDATFSLPNKLTEISGLGLTSDGTYVLAVNDEQGKIFFLDKQNGEVKKEVKFQGVGDYEGVEMVGDKIYVAKSNGNLYEIKHANKKKPGTKVFKVDLGAANDVEGLGYDAAKHCLLLACKGKAGSGDQLKRQRAVYAFDLKKEKLVQEPVYLIDRDEIKKWAESSAAGLTEKLAEFFEPSLADDAFAPSGIAVHPKSREVYILSSVGKILVVLDTAGKIRHIEPLDAALHKQPEGICFEPDGTLFISNEGKGGIAKVYRFNAK